MDSIDLDTFELGALDILLTGGVSSVEVSADMLRRLLAEVRRRRDVSRLSNRRKEQVRKLRKSMDMLVGKIDSFKRFADSDEGADG